MTRSMTRKKMPFSFLTSSFPNTKTHSKPSHFPQDTIPVFFPLRCFNSLLPGTQVVLTRSPAPLQKCAGGRPQAVSQRQRTSRHAGLECCKQHSKGNGPGLHPPFVTRQWQLADICSFPISKQQRRGRAEAACFSQEVVSLPSLLMLSRVLGSITRLLFSSYLPASDS